MVTKKIRKLLSLFIYLFQIWIFNLLIRKYASQCRSEKNPPRNCTSRAEGTHLPVIIFYLSRIYRHLLRSHYYVWLNKCSKFIYIPFNCNYVGFRNCLYILCIYFSCIFELFECCHFPGLFCLEDVFCLFIKA